MKNQYTSTTVPVARKRALLRRAIGSALCLWGLSAASIGYGADAEKDRIDRMEETIRLLQQEIQTLKEEKNNRPTIITERLDDIEEVVFDLDERVGSRAVINAFEGMSLDIGGFLHSTFSHADGEQGSASSFNRNIFELLVKAELSKKWSAFVAQAFIRESSPNFDDPSGRLDPSFTQVGKTPQVIAWANYKHSDLLNVQFGRFITPHGIINIEHFPAILLDPEQPQFLRPFGGQTIFPNFVNGLQLHGKKFFDDGNSLEYNAYTAEFAGNNDDLIFGGRLGYNFEEAGVSIGLNASSGDRARNTDSDYDMTGIDLLIDRGALSWKTEYFSTSEANGADRTAYYTQPAWRLDDKWTVFYRYDFLDDGTGNGDRTENVVGVNYTPLSNIRLRATYTMREIDGSITLFDLDSDPLTPEVTAPAADADIFQLSATLSF